MPRGRPSSINVTPADLVKALQTEGEFELTDATPQQVQSLRNLSQRIKNQVGEGQVVTRKSTNSLKVVLVRDGEVPPPIHTGRPKKVKIVSDTPGEFAVGDKVQHVDPTSFRKGTFEVRRVYTNKSGTVEAEVAGGKPNQPAFRTFLADQLVKVSA